MIQSILSAVGCEEAALVTRTSSLQWNKALQVNIACACQQRGHLLKMWAAKILISIFAALWWDSSSTLRYGGILLLCTKRTLCMAITQEEYECLARSFAGDQSGLGEFSDISHGS